MDDVGGLEDVGFVKDGEIDAGLGDEVDVALGDARKKEVVHHATGAGDVRNQEIEAMLHDLLLKRGCACVLRTF